MDEDNDSVTEVNLQLLLDFLIGHKEEDSSGISCNRLTLFEDGSGRVEHWPQGTESKTPKILFAFNEMCGDTTGLLSAFQEYLLRDVQ